MGGAGDVMFTGGLKFVAVAEAQAPGGSFGRAAQAGCRSGVNFT